MSAAGGLGLIGEANAPAEVIQNYIREVKAVTDKPFGVNVMLMSPYADEVAKVVVEEGVKLRHHRCRKPGEIHGDVEDSRHQGKSGGCFGSSGQENGALRCRCRVAEGTESGGHIGEATTMTLVPAGCGRSIHPGDRSWRQR